jgi:inositol transport system permease protein
MSNMQLAQDDKGRKSLRDERVKEYISRYGVAFGIVILGVVFSLASPSFLDTGNFLNILKQTSINAFIAVGIMFVIVAGGIDLSVGSNVAVTCIMLSLFLSRQMGTGVSVVLALAIATGIGLVNGIACAYTRIPPFIVTLSMLTIGRGLALIISQGTPIYVRNDFMAWLGRGAILGIPTSIVILIVFLVLSWVILNKTKIGRYTYAIGGNIETAKLSGIRVGSYITFTYAYLGFLTGVAAVIMTGRLASGTPTIGTGYELDAIAAAVLGGTAFTGGTGTVAGTMLGAIFIGVMNNGMTILNVSPYFQAVLRGVVIFVSVLISVVSSTKKR